MKVWAVETVATSMVVEDSFEMKVMSSKYFGLFEKFEDARKTVEEWYAKKHPGKNIYAVGDGWSMDDDGSYRGFFIVREVIDGEEGNQEAHCVVIRETKIN